MPGEITRSDFAGPSGMIFTGIRWTVFTKLPVTFSGDSSAKFEPVPRWKLSMWTCSVSRENRSSRAMTGLTGEVD